MKVTNMKPEQKRESAATCAATISAAVRVLRKTGHPTEIITDAILDELYCGENMDADVVEPILEECRRRRNEAFGGTFEEYMQREAEM
jgi:hypothetical protein